MTNWLNKINDNFPIRRTKEQKAKFINYTKEELKKYNINVVTETLKNKHTNIIIGDVEKAKVIFTAHYDTPATSLFPNLMLPRFKVLSYIYMLIMAFTIVGISFIFSFLLNHFIKLDDNILIALYLIIYFLMFYLLTRCFNNKNNINDNTSGVATVFSLIENAANKDVAYILFDNEEKGKLGSKYYSKEHSDILHNKYIVNFDCVGNGNNFLIICKNHAIMHPYYKCLEQCIDSNDIYNVQIYGMKGSSSNTDFLNFDCSISVMACKKSKIIGYYTPNIHTALDTIAKKENIEFLTNSFVNFINNIQN